MFYHMINDLVIHHVKEHNHYLTHPPEIYLLHYAKKITKDEVNCINDMLNSSIKYN